MRTILKLTGLCGTGLLFTVVFLLFTGRDVKINLPASVIAGLLMMLVWLYASAGYKRIYFLLLSASGTLTILFSLKIPPGPSTLLIFKSSAVDIFAGTVLLLSCRFISVKAFFNTRKFSLYLLFFTSAFLFGMNFFAPDFLKAEEDLAYSGNLKGEAERYIKKIHKDTSLLKKEKEKMIEKLTIRIKQLEGEMALFNGIKEQNKKYRDEITRLKDKVGTVSMCHGLKEGKMVHSIREAVHSSGSMVSPCVRDFAVKLASAYPGSYYRSGSSAPSPGTAGMKQIIAVHRYISSQWKYINDPLVASRDYYSPADRTIAVGLAGDCDDFAILMAACIEAIGGKSRILGGTCSKGAHAWCEVYIGNKAAWDQALRVLHMSYSGQSRQNYWLSLDWKIGTYSCGGRPRILYQ